MFVRVNRRIQGKAQMRDRDPVRASIPSEDESFEWLVGMRDRDPVLLARVNNRDEAGLSKLALLSVLRA